MSLPFKFKFDHVGVIKDREGRVINDRVDDVLGAIASAVPRRLRPGVCIVAGEGISSDSVLLVGCGVFVWIGQRCGYSPHYFDFCPAMVGCCPVL